jgi:hypothetical protein
MGMFLFLFWKLFERNRASMVMRQKHTAIMHIMIDPASTYTASTCELCYTDLKTRARLV